MSAPISRFELLCQEASMGFLRVVKPVMGTAEGDEVFDLILSSRCDGDLMMDFNECGGTAFSSVNGVAALSTISLEDLVLETCF